MLYYDSIPDCVPEYFREAEEARAHEAELRDSMNRFLEKNKEYTDDIVAKGGTLMCFSYPERCESCPFGEEKLSFTPEDDVPGILCKNPDSKWCLTHRVWGAKCEIRRWLYQLKQRFETL